jgi:hypothetical protein
MNNADSTLDIEELRRQADAVELKALRADRLGSSSKKLYAKARELRADALAIEQRMASFKNLKH